MNCTIASNPDIAGIGVRWSVYGQSILAMVQTLSAGSMLDEDFHIETETSNGLKNTSVAVLLTGCGLLISSFIQAKSPDGLTIYHAFILLNLSWLNNLTAFLASLWTLIDLAGDEGDFFNVRKTILPFIFSPPFIASTIHFSAMGAFGVWLFNSMSTVFMPPPPCQSDTVFYTLFTGNVSATDDDLRSLFNGVYWVGAIPYLNYAATIFGYVCMLIGIFTPLGAVVTCCGMIDIEDFMEWEPQWLVKPIVSAVWCIPVIICNVFLILGTETLVRVNRPLVEEGEGDWSFGQTLAVLLLVLPLRDTVAQVWLAGRTLIRRSDPAYAQAYSDEERSIRHDLTSTIPLVTLSASGKVGKQPGEDGGEGDGESDKEEERLGGLAAGQRTNTQPDSEHPATQLLISQHRQPLPSFSGPLRRRRRHSF